LGRFSFGQIILAYFYDGKGRTKERPCVVISSNESNDAGEALQVVAITGKFRRAAALAPRPDAVESRWFGPDGAEQSVCREVQLAPRTRPRQVIKSVGYLPPELMAQIVAEFDRLYEDETFTEWV
jgi:mRNA-degrading endonuclease toxin of MazEF toxin-antitoxin module